MLLVFDVGNTKTAIGLHDGERWVCDWRISTQAERLADEMAPLLDSLLAGAGVSRADIGGLAAASVVPSATEVLRTLAERHFGSPLFVLNHKTARGIRLAVDTPEETGPDRIANTAAVHHLYGVAAIVLDAGYRAHLRRGVRGGGISGRGHRARARSFRRSAGPADGAPAPSGTPAAEARRRDAHRRRHAVGARPRLDRNGA